MGAKGRKLSLAMKKYHKKAGRKKSHAGVRKAARTRWKKR